MSAKVIIEGYFLSDLALTRQQIKDLIDVLYRGNDTIRVHGRMHPEWVRKPTRGLHCYNGMFGEHDIYLSPQRIVEGFDAGIPCGGNVRAPNLPIAVGMVLAHEVMHANQSVFHADGASYFYGKKRSRYRTRPCEMEARTFADDSIPIIAGVLGVELPREKLIVVPPHEIELIAECLAEADVITTADIVEELRQSGCNNSVNVQKVKWILAEMGVPLS